MRQEPIGEPVSFYMAGGHAAEPTNDGVDHADAQTHARTHTHTHTERIWRQCADGSGGGRGWGGEGKARAGLEELIEVVCFTTGSLLNAMSPLGHGE